jgi:hypothetical protein
MSKSPAKILAALMAASLLATASVRATPIPYGIPSDISDIVFFQGSPIVIFQEGQPQFAYGWLSGPQHGVVLFYQDAAMTVLSDQIWNDFSDTYGFASDPDLQNLSGLPVLARFVETGAPQDVSGYFGLPPGILMVQSDLNVPDTGTTCSLLGLSLMGLAFLRRKLC